MRSRLLVSSLTVAVALLIEVAMVGHGFAQCPWNYCGYEGPIVPECSWSGTERLVPVPRGRGIDGVVEEDAIDKGEWWLPRWELRRRASIVQGLPSNRYLRSRPPGCLCYGDAFCVPENFTPIPKRKPPVPQPLPPLPQGAGYCLYYSGYVPDGGTILTRGGVEWHCDGRTGRWWRTIYGSPELYYGMPKS
jgi:hypothetical protein